MKNWRAFYRLAIPLGMTIFATRAQVIPNRTKRRLVILQRSVQTPDVLHEPQSGIIRDDVFVALLGNLLVIYFWTIVNEMLFGDCVVVSFSFCL